jgi:nucleotide-binding universal stress UspA family protein
MARRLLVGFDGSRASRAALEEAAELARREHGTLTVVTAIWPGMLEGCAWLAPAAGPRPDPEQLASSCLRAAIDALPPDVSVTWLARRGDPASVLAREAEAHCCDAIAIGRRGFAHLLAGGVARALRRHTELPVMVLGSRLRAPAPLAAPPPYSETGGGPIGRPPTVSA